MFFRVLFTFFLVVFLTAFAPARAGDLVLVLSDRGGVYAEFAEALRMSVQGSDWRIVATVTPEALAVDASLRSADVWVSVGTEATRLAMQQARSQAVLAALIPRNSFERLLAKHGTVRPKGGLAAVVLDQPLARQLLFIQHLLPTRKRIGLLAGPEARASLMSNKQLPLAKGLVLETEEVDDDAAVVPAANRLLARSDVLLALPDSLIYSRNNIRPLLLASYRFQRPMIGYSAAFVSAGALAAIYSTPVQIAGQVADALITGRKPMPLIQFPVKYSLSYNRQVAESLGINLPDESVVMRMLETKRHEP